MTYRKYEFTAFTEADLVSGGDTNLGCGDIFTMPETATTCILVRDNDPFLSGDSYKNERANDHYGQQATIEGEDGSELGNGGQIYAESYFWVTDSDGNKYVLIEIEQEGTSGDYFTFYTGSGYSAPPAGAELTVGSKCNVKGNWVDYKCLDAGDKIETGTISGTVFCDVDCDGINGEVEEIPGCDYTIEAEDMWGYGFTTVYGDQASGGKLVKLKCAGGDGLLCTTFDGKDGVYDVKIRVQDENDGQSKIKLKVNGELVEAIRLDGDGDGGGSNNGGFSTFVIKDVDLSAGDDISIAAWGDGKEFVRIDNIELEGQDQEIRTEEPVKAGVTIKLLDASGEVVATTTTDEDGNYEFADVPVGDYKIMGVATDGTEFTIQDAGSDDSIDSDVDASGMSGVVTVTANSTTDIDLGLKEVKLGSLSGRYFCDTNDDDLDDGEPGIGGVVVMLLDATGVPTGATTVTAPNGSYSFSDLAPGTYGVKFTDPDGVLDGKQLVDANVGADDTIDSDAIGDTAMSVIKGITVNAGEDTPDNDAGAEYIPGSLSGRYFCDTDGDSQDNGNGDEPGIGGVVVMLLDATGAPTGATTVTAPNGSYSFSDLAPGTYGVKFTDPDGVLGGKQLVDANVGDDASDSDAIGDTAMSAIVGIEVAAGTETPDNDAGVEYNLPTPVDDAAVICADETVNVGLLENDPSGLSVVSISDEDETAGVGETITLVSGATVTLNADGSVSYDGTVAYADLLIGETAIDSFSYSASNGFAEASADVDIGVCGASYTLESIAASLPASICFENTPLTPDLPEDAFTITLSGSGDASLDGLVIEEAYCIDANLDFENNVKVDATIAVASYESAIANGLSELAASNMDSINWILNQQFDDQPNGEGGTYTDLEVQGAIWQLTNGDDFLFGPGGLVGDGPEGNQANVDEIVAAALSEGDGFVAGDGDLVGLLLLPDAGQPDTNQPYILAHAPECVCDEFDFV